jgi:hypothetical protein
MSREEQNLNYYHAGHLSDRYGTVESSDQAGLPKPEHG